VKSRLWRVDPLDDQLMVTLDDLVHVVEQRRWDISETASVLGHEQRTVVDRVLWLETERESVSMGEAIDRSSLAACQVAHSMHKEGQVDFAALRQWSEFIGVTRSAATRDGKDLKRASFSRQAKVLQCFETFGPMRIDDALCKDRKERRAAVLCADSKPR